MPTFVVVLVLAIVFTGALALFQSLYWAYMAKKEQQVRELSRRLGMIGDEGGDTLFRERARDTVAEALGNLGEHLRVTLVSADSEMTVGGLLARMGGLAAVLAIIGVFVFGITGALIGVVGGAVPYMILRSTSRKRARLLLEQLPDALDLMARSMQAGLGLTDAFRLTAEEMPLPIAAEFGRVFEEIRLGRDWRTTLGNLLERNHDVFDLRLFVSSVLLQRETGGNLIEILDNIASTIRQRFLFEAKVRALTAEAKFSALILGALPIVVSMLIFVMNPEYLKPLAEDPLGNIMVLYCVASYGMGIFIMRDISKVDV